MALSRRTGQRFQASIWPGFVDAMTGLLLVLMFVLTIFMVVQFVLRETITGQESQLDELSAEVSALASALGLEERENNQLNARLGALTSTLNTAEQDLDQARSLITSLTADRDRQAGELAAAASRITSFEAQVAALIASRDAARTRVADLSAERADLEAARAELLSEQEALNLALSQARGEIDLQAEAARLAAAQREAMEALIASLESEGSEQTTRISELQDRLGAEEAARLVEAAAAEALRDRLQNADAELTAMTLALEAQRQEAEDTLTLLAAAETARTQLDAQLSELETARAGSDAEAGKLAAELAEAKAALAAAEIQAGELDILRQRLLAAVTAQQRAEGSATEQLSLAEERAALLAQARSALSEEQAISEEARRETALLNQQVAALREQLGGLQAILDDYQGRDAAQQVQLQNLGQDLNAALARAASEERKRRLLEEQERKRLAAEAAALASKAQDLERYRSEFFGRLRDLLGTQEGVRIQGDRFVFASEVLFAPGSATLSPAGRVEIAKVVSILQSVVAAIPQEINWIIRVDGHTDTSPLLGHPKFIDNWELSQGRALSVVRYMVEALGVPPSRLAANGFGEYQPVNPADTAQARAQNRRIELKFTEK
ncbi:peptidoglycan -binding protein [Leisingera sp. M658]|uniref:peptidoglycan -binding protein n=1 Tax=Leisingera sp. M658 TaxID=2867015 RepID=UPI0021A5A07B|nr:peptidoglycan -binding protein [Leisingera sp. M658]UWQ75904.1 peptidoglycan -binding protein [Leisingera sp. M658]